MANTKIETVVVEKIVREDQQRYVLTLDMDEARLLGSLRRFYVHGGSKLHDILRELPYTAMHNQVAAMLDVNEAQILALRRDRAKLMNSLEASQKEVARLSDALTASVASGGTQTLPLVGGSWHTTAEAEVVPVSKGWKVQYKTYTRGWMDVPANGRDTEGDCLASTRNGAYRAMRDRSKHFHNPLSSYRVVPYEHADGIDPPDTRGKYIVELGIRSSGKMEWIRSQYVPGEYASADHARIAITNLGARNSKYRVKWVP